MLYKLLYSNTRKIDKACQYIKLLEDYQNSYGHNLQIENSIAKYKNKVLTPQQHKALRTTVSIITIQIINKIKGKKTRIDNRIKSHPKPPVGVQPKPLVESQVPEFIIYEEDNTKLKILKSNLEYFTKQAKKNKLTKIYNFLCSHS